jgi:AMP-activated protein kinase-like protein
MRPDAEAGRDDQFGERVASRLRGPVPLSERVEREVLARIDQEPIALNHRARARRAAAALAVAAGIAAVFTIGVLVGRRSGVQPGLGSEAQPVEFVLRTAADSTVALVGDFNDWNPRATPLRPTSDSVWSVVVPLRPGRYRYTFVVDGTRWSRDPSAPKALEDDFGRPTSVITVAQR